PQRKMIRNAVRYHAIRGFIFIGGLVAGAILLWIGSLLVLNKFLEPQIQAMRARNTSSLVQQVLHTETAAVPAVVADMAYVRDMAVPLLRDEFAKAKEGSREKLHASLALLPVDPAQVEYLYGQLLQARPEEITVLRDTLLPYKANLTKHLWAL